MRSILFLFLVVLFLGCRKTSNHKPTAELIQGVWQATNSKLEFYDAANQKVFERPEQQGTSPIIITDQYITFTPSGARGTYTLTQQQGREYLNAYQSAEELPQPFEIKNLTASRMTWVVDLPPLAYTDKGVKKQAAKSLLRIDFLKK